MKNRTTTIVLDGKKRLIFCDNAATMRMEEAGGRISEFDAKPMSTIAAFILGNLLDEPAAPKDEPQPILYTTKEQVLNALSNIKDAMKLVEEIFTGSTFFSDGDEKKSGETGEVEELGQKASSGSD